MKKTLLAGVVALFAAAANANAAVNIAADLSAQSYTQSSTWNGYSAQSAFNGGGWNSGNFGYQWIQVDLGSVKNIASVQYALDLLPNNNVIEQVFVSNSAIGTNWTSLAPVATFNGFGSNGDVLNQTLNTSGRYLQIVANGGQSWTALSNVNVAAVPEPETYAMMLAGLGLVAAISRRKKAA
ncbi:discoidin domain-containing protein [Duganella qianjiadongensis]|uniref:discoidin domain-containing protein n=1 Tax=Duganella qianjiadongensis TaxID=2692176 RepID=UPI001E5975CB|nr:discoidin domain-containing protein [Duganella qianjiadongensis]